MSGLLSRITASRVTTDPAAADRRRGGRTYAISFERVWNAVLALAGGGLPRWTVEHHDDEAGRVEATAITAVFRTADEVVVEVGLDDNGQTRVDATWTAGRHGPPPLGRGHRTLGRLFRALDRELDATPAQILDATRPPTFSA